MSKQDLKTIQEWKAYAKEKGISDGNFKEFEKYLAIKRLEEKGVYLSKTPMEE